MTMKFIRQNEEQEGRKPLEKNSVGLEAAQSATGMSRRRGPENRPGNGAMAVGCATGDGHPATGEGLRPVLCRGRANVDKTELDPFLR